ncbi:uncharacterized protein LOC142972598 [Anticarsia gemmatalis]|uniref:uncharacterized protein LOC142972598 n=1 Tax=Anticarsia gemmatalis TaxID=129554 RepID=UPI003F75A175
MLTCFQVTVAMDAKDLRTESALSERNNDSSKYSQSGGIALHCDRNKSYQDIGSNSLAKVDVPSSRPCAVIGPDRIVPPPVSSEAYLKKGPAEPWPCMVNAYRRPPEYPHKLANYQNPTRNISPRQTFQENMQRIMVPPTYNSVKISDDTNYAQLSDRSNALPKNIKLNVPPEAKFCDVPYTVYPPSNEQKNVKNPEMCLPSVNPTLTRTVPHGWPPGSVNIRPARMYGAPELYQYQEYPSCAGPRPVVPRPNRTVPEESGYVYDVPFCHQEGNIRFKPYPTVKERFPQQRYEYIGNYTNSFHPPPTFPSHKYELQKPVPPHPYPPYPPIKYLDRVPEPVMEGYQRNQQGGYSIPYRNQIIHPNYGPVLTNGPQNKIHSYPPDAHLKTVAPNKLPYDNTKAYIEYENGRPKMYTQSDNYLVNEMGRMHPMKSQVIMPNYPPINMHNIPTNPYYKKDNQHMKNYEYIHYRSMDPNLNIHNPMMRHPPVFSPNTLAISPTDSSASNDTAQTLGTSQEDCGYVSQSSTASVRSMDSGIHRIPNDCLRKYYDNRYGPIIRTPSMMSKSDINSNSHSKEKKNIDVRQFLQMWNEGDEETDENNSKQIIISSGPKSDHNLSKAHEVMTSNQEQLYVLGLVNVPSEELDKYEHIQKVSKLPENIKGYNNLELLSQFEEVTESSNKTNYKPSTPKDFQMPLKGVPLKQPPGIGPPRPLSPLDVEAKISQSVIHKEVGCNFEIKPCSPKMLNVEVATPVQNILAERAIEKVTNPVMLKSPRLNSIDENIDCNMMKRQDHRLNINNDPVRIASCKMVNTQFSNNNSIDAIKNSYSLQDLESNSGLCLASLPRLDNDIELNFPEVNQQFINANKPESIVLTSSVRDLPTLEVLEQSESLTKDTVNDINALTQDNEIIKCVVDSEKEFSKLSKYRKTKSHSVDTKEHHHHNINAARTDSVIIKNPENTKKHEENSIFSPNTMNRQVSDIQQVPINLTSQGTVSENVINIPTHVKTDIVNKENSSVESAIDFSLNKQSSNHNDECTLSKSAKESELETCTNIKTDHSIIKDSPSDKLPIFSECSENTQDNLNHDKLAQNTIRNLIKNSDSECVARDITEDNNKYSRSIEHPPLDDIFMENACLSPLHSVEGVDDESECMSPPESLKDANDVSGESVLPIDFMEPPEELFGADAIKNSILMDADKNVDIVDTHLDKPNNSSLESEQDDYKSHNQNQDVDDTDKSENHIIDVTVPDSRDAGVDADYSNVLSPKLASLDRVIEAELDMNASHDNSETYSSIIENVPDSDSTKGSISNSKTDLLANNDYKTDFDIEPCSPKEIKSCEPQSPNSEPEHILEETAPDLDFPIPNKIISQRSHSPDYFQSTTDKQESESYLVLASSNNISMQSPNNIKPESEIALSETNSLVVTSSNDIEMRNHNDDDLTNKSDHQDFLDEVSVFSTKFCDVEENAAVNNLPANEEDVSQTEISIQLSTKEKSDTRVTRYLSYGSKEMYSPWIQNLIVYCEGTIGIVPELKEKSDIVEMDISCDFHHSPAKDDDNTPSLKQDNTNICEMQYDIQKTGIEISEPSAIKHSPEVSIFETCDDSFKATENKNEDCIETNEQSTSHCTKEVENLQKDRDIENELHIIMTGSPMITERTSELENFSNSQDAVTNKAVSSLSLKVQKQRKTFLTCHQESFDELDQASIFDENQSNSNDEISKQLEALESTEPTCNDKGPDNCGKPDCEDELHRQLNDNNKIPDELDCQSSLTEELSNKSVKESDAHDRFDKPNSQSNLEEKMSDDSDSQSNSSDDISNQSDDSSQSNDDTLSESDGLSDDQEEVEADESGKLSQYDEGISDQLERLSKCDEGILNETESRSQCNDSIPGQLATLCDRDNKVPDEDNQTYLDKDEQDQMDTQPVCDKSLNDSVEHQPICDFVKPSEMETQSYSSDLRHGDSLEEHSNSEKHVLDQPDPEVNCDNSRVKEGDKQCDCVDEIPDLDGQSNINELVPEKIKSESDCLDKTSEHLENSNVDDNISVQNDRQIDHIETELANTIEPTSDVELPNPLDGEPINNNETSNVSPKQHTDYNEDSIDKHDEQSNCDIEMPCEIARQSNGVDEVPSPSDKISSSADKQDDCSDSSNHICDEITTDHVNRESDFINEIIEPWDKQTNTYEEIPKQSDCRFNCDNDILSQLDKQSNCDSDSPSEIDKQFDDKDELTKHSDMKSYCDEVKSDQVEKQTDNGETLEQLNNLSNSNELTSDQCETQFNCENIEEESSTVMDKGELSYAKTRTNQIINKQRKSLKRSLSDSALNIYGNNESAHQENEESVQFVFPLKRRKVNHVDSDILAQNLCNIIQSNRRNSISSIYNEENVSFCILIDNSCIIAEEESEEQEKICYTELPEECLAEIQDEFAKNEENEEAITEVMPPPQDENNCEYSDSFAMQSEDEKTLEESWVEDVACVETVISDDIAEDIEISSQSSPKDEMSDNDESGVFSSSEHTDKVRYIYGNKMCNDDAQFVETLYNTPQMNVNKTLGDRETLTSGEYYDNDSLEKILSESNEPELSPYVPEYIEPVYSPRLVDVKEIADDKENMDIEAFSPLQNKLDPLEEVDTGADVVTQENINTNHILHETQDGTVHSCESSVDDVFTYKENDSNTNYITSSSPEVSSTTSEERNSAILLKITNYKGSRTAQINDIRRDNKRPSCKFTENQGYVQSQSNYSAHRPLLTKAAQKYIPPLKESMRDLKVKLSLPQHSLIKLKQLKKSKDEPKVCKQNVSVPKVSKKPKPKFEDVLKSIDEIQFKMHKEKTKKTKKSIPKVVIKKNENGSHYASTSSNKDEFNPDLTGRKWQPWVFIEKNHFIDKMAMKNKTKAVYSHRKKTYVLAEKFRKYKSVNSAKFVISPPISDCPSTGLKYTIRLKHTY